MTKVNHFIGARQSQNGIARGLVEFNFSSFNFVHDKREVNPGMFTNLNVQVLDGLFGLDEVEVEGESGDLVRPVGHEEDGELELGDVLAILLVEDLEGLDQLVRHALHHAHLRLRLVLARAQRERHRTVLLAHLKEFRSVG